MWRTWKIFTHIFQQYVGFIPLDSHPMVYFITQEMRGSSHQIFHRIRKFSKTHRMGRAWEIGSHIFIYKMCEFFHQITILQYTSSYGKCMIFPISFPQHEKRQKNPSNGKSLRNCFPGESCKTHRMQKTWEIGTHNFPIIWTLFSHQIISYGILYNM